MKQRLPLTLFIFSIIIFWAAPLKGFAARNPQDIPPSDTPKVIHTATGVMTVILKDSINPGTSMLISRAIHTAEKDNAYLIVELNTPGGLLTATRDIVSDIMEAQIPVVVYITPSGAQAASAGMIITISAHYAAMAPATNIGAAHPVLGTGGSMDKTMEEKVVNDTVAFVRSISIVRKRNTGWIEKGVRESASITAPDAVANQVVDGIYASRAELLQSLTQKEIITKGDQLWKLSPGALHTITELTPQLREQLISLLGNPNIAFGLLGLGGLGLYVEFTHPGLIFPGVSGGICILLGMVSLQMLPVRWGALGLFFLGLALLIAELFLPSFGMLGVGGMGSMILGAIYLFDTSQGIAGVDSRLVIGFGVGIGLIFLFILYSLSQLRNAPKHVGGGKLDGLVGRVTHFNPATKTGTCFCHGEIWGFSTLSNDLAQDDEVVVERTEGLHLIVSKKTKSDTRQKI